MTEIWKDLNNYEDFYIISNKGNIKSKTREVKTKGGKTRTVKRQDKALHINKRGYQITTLYKLGKAKTHTIHQLVAQTFIKDFVKGTELNHIDGNKLNNCLNNLEPSNPSHNQLHAVANGLRTKESVSKYHNVSYLKNPRAIKKWAVCMKVVGEKPLWKTFLTELEAAQFVDEYLDSINDLVRPRNFS